MRELRASRQPERCLLDLVVAPDGDDRVAAKIGGLIESLVTSSACGVQIAQDAELIGRSCERLPR
jgi:hypothetical protein